jgi:hypothetical protein
LGVHGFSLTLGVFVQYFFQWKKLHSDEQKEKNDQNKKEI